MCCESPDCPCPCGGSVYVFATWRDRIAQAHQQIAWATRRRQMVFQEAFRSGLSCRQIGEAAGMSAAGVHKIIGKQRSADLDSGDAMVRVQQNDEAEDAN